MSALLEQVDRHRPSAARWPLQVLWPLAAAALFGLLMFRVIGPAMGGFATVLLVIGINIVLAVSLTVVNGFTGQFSMGHGGFMAVGGYVAAMIVYYGSLRLWGSANFAGAFLSSASGDGAWLAGGDVLFVVACLAAGLAAAGAGYLVGLPSLRLKGDYLAIVTLGFGEIVRVVLQGTAPQIARSKADVVRETPVWKLVTHLGGAQGFNLLPTYATLFWIYFAAVLTLIVVYRLKMSSSGRAFLSIREDEIASQAMGVNVTKYKVRAFVLSSFFAGVAGGLYAMYLGAINATDLGFQRSFEVIIMVVLGGMGSISGATLAAILLSILPEVLRAPPPVWPAGLALLVVMVIIQKVGISFGLTRGPADGIVLNIAISMRSLRRSWKFKPLVIVAGVTMALETARLVCLQQQIDIAQYRMVLYALMLIIMMIVRPEGLFGVREFWDYLPRRRAHSPSGPVAEASA